MSTGLSDIPKFNFASCFLCIVGKQLPPYVPNIYHLDYPAATIRSYARNKMHDTLTMSKLSIGGNHLANT